MKINTRSASTNKKDKIIKQFDLKIMLRILKYVKPYLLHALIAIIFLIITTAGQMLLPVLVQQGVDQYIMPFKRQIDLTKADKELSARLVKLPNSFQIGEQLFLQVNSLADFSDREKENLVEKNILSAENYFVFPAKTEINEIIKNYPEIFISSNSFIAVKETDFDTIKEEHKKILKAGDYQGLTNISLLFLFVQIGLFAFAFFQIYLIAYVSQRVMKDLRLELFEHTLNFKLSYLDSQPVGKLVTRVTSDVETVNELFSSVLTSFLIDLFLMVGVLITLTILSPRLTLVAIVLIPLIVVASFLFKNKARNAYRRVREAISRLNSFMSEHFSGMKIVQLFTREKRSVEEFKNESKIFYKARLGEMYVFASFRPLIDLLSSISVALIIYFGAGFYLDNIVSLGVLIAFIHLIQKFYQPVMDLADKYNLLQSAMAGGERIFDLLDTKESIKQKSKKNFNTKEIKGDIQFKDVNFYYKKGEPVLNNLSFNAKEGETIAIVGYTGAGKTTITSLLTRFWDIQSGSIMIDGKDIKDYPVSFLRNNVQSVLQDVFLFSGTVKENITLGKPITDEQLKNAAKLVCADKFIEKLPDKYETVLDERGANLSTGQRQLIAFTRIVAHNPRVLILDEATGNIDTETESLIQKGLKEVLHGRTSLVIAHRLSTIKNANKIIVLHAGRLAEQGTHEELIRKKGIYYNLYTLQIMDEE